MTNRKPTEILREEHEMADMHLGGTQLDEIIKLFAEIEDRPRRTQP